MLHNPVQFQNGIRSREFLFLFLYETEDRCFGSLFQWH